MNFFEAVKSAFSKYGVIAGRSVRSEYWYFTLFVTIGGFIFQVLATQNIDAQIPTGILITSLIFYLVTLIPHITVTARRLHDVDRSGWWVLITITIIGIIPYLYWVCKKGDEGENRFGPDPLASHDNGATTNISASSVTTDDPINDGPQDVPSSEEPETSNPPQTSAVQANEKECPRCAEVIKLRAKFCLHCSYEYSDDEFKKEQNLFAKEERKKIKTDKERREAEGVHHLGYQIINTSDSTYEIFESGIKVKDSGCYESLQEAKNYVNDIL